MSYARWSDESDVYVYPSERVDGTKYIVCVACDLPGSIAYTAADAAAHQQRHVDAGYKVPARLLDPDTYLDRGLAGVDS